LGFLRDDAGKFLDAYYTNKIYESDPFARLDIPGVGKIVKIAVEAGRRVRPNIKLGICGEHGGDPSTVAFCHEIGLTMFLVPIPCSYCQTRCSTSCYSSKK
jgi:pyruvate,orthophosphate dikinase